MINYNSVYVVFLVFVIGGVFATAYVELRDDGACKRTTDGGLAVRQPNSQYYTDSEFCIWVWI